MTVSRPHPSSRGGCGCCGDPEPALGFPRLDRFGASSLAMTPGFTLFQTHSNGKRCAGRRARQGAQNGMLAVLRSGAGSNESPRIAAQIPPDSERLPIGAPFRSMASSAYCEQVGRRRQRGPSIAKWYSGKYRLAPWPPFLGNSPFGATFPSSRTALVPYPGLKGRWHPLRSRVCGAPHCARDDGQSAKRHSPSSGSDAKPMRPPGFSTVKSASARPMPRNSSRRASSSSTDLTFRCAASTTISPG